ncbi:hypothetical protein VOLCADRAFT_107644 [Volvox carteri f. nagariensis]|uniref:Uncharacterized protein n=1 Tax=Volvox carteri f. nagariensis TaxID=3068 RepID=D8UFD8_VOLCA|nr:uncharacterized protein VOLCADRAFT_107644 [Volvox carteri f. nagariensis]EFJ41591.1 hypothetical protein VOLCADRAFT_107644 [Volvox carteri f. nagariensis]|eukprot:XP_002957382.1 hypothetical protein VOLCADRAFT_107644 [Volvox carteri f. nagariensis]
MGDIQPKAGSDTAPGGAPSDTRPCGTGTKIYEFNCLKLRDRIKRDKFVGLVRVKLAKKEGVIQAPHVLYRGVRLYREGNPNDKVAFFTDNVTDAVTYAKFNPRAVYVFEPQHVNVWDMTNKDVLYQLCDYARKCDLPDDVITKFAAMGNRSFESDMFHLLETTMRDEKVHGFYRETFSSSLNRVAGEYALYRAILPDHIP